MQQVPLSARALLVRKHWAVKSFRSGFNKISYTLVKENQFWIVNIASGRMSFQGGYLMMPSRKQILTLQVFVNSLYIYCSVVAGWSRRIIKGSLIDIKPDILFFSSSVSRLKLQIKTPFGQTPKSLASTWEKSNRPHVV